MGENAASGNIRRLSLSPDSDRESYVKSLLPDYTVASIEQDSTSSQAMALEFVVKDPLLESYPEWRIQQRFALATFYYATHGDHWYNNTGWLEYFNETNQCSASQATSRQAGTNTGNFIYLLFPIVPLR